MREIKFRAWDKEEGRMITNIQKAYDGMGNSCINGKYYGFVSCFDDFLDDERFIVEQYTGLKDANGTEIYEGDITKLILDNGEERYFEVSIRKMIRQVLDFNYELSDVEIMGVCFIWNGRCLFPCVDEYGISDTTKMEVVGNIHFLNH